MSEVANRIIGQFVVLGDERVGKSALITQVSGGDFMWTNKSLTIGKFVSNSFVPEYQPTIEDQIRHEFKFGSVQFVADIIDTTGEKKYRHIPESWYMSADGFLVVFDAGSVTSLQSAKRQVRDIQGNELLQGARPLAIVATKSDLAPLAEGDIIDLRDEFDAPVYQTSALDHKTTSKIFTDFSYEICRYKLDKLVELSQNALNSRDKTNEEPCASASITLAKWLISLTRSVGSCIGL